MPKSSIIDNVGNTNVHIIEEGFLIYWGIQGYACDKSLIIDLFKFQLKYFLMRIRSSLNIERITI